jgi:tetratricopeptide (TPR) repeat protein
MRAGIVVLIGMALCLPRIGRADPMDDPDTTAARRHFDAGLHYYDHEDFKGALAEFQAARRSKPLPAFDYNIGRCYDRLEMYNEAIDLYERYLRAAPQSSDAAEVRGRIDALKERVKVIAPPPPTESSPFKRPLVWGLVGGGAAVVIVVAVVLGVTLGGGSSFPVPSLGSIRGN